MLSFVVPNSLILYHLLDVSENDNSVKVQPGLTFLGIRRMLNFRAGFGIIRNNKWA